MIQVLLWERGGEEGEAGEEAGGHLCFVGFGRFGEGIDAGGLVGLNAHTAIVAAV